MLKVHLKNADDTERRMLVFPESERMQKQDEENVLQIRAVESPLGELNRCMQGMWLRPRYGMWELKFLDRHIEGMTETEKTVFQAALEIEKPTNIIELVNLSCNLDKFALYENAADPESLGKYVQERGKAPKTSGQDADCRTVGEQYAQEHMGCFTGLGYVVRTGEALEPVYAGEHLPDPGYDKCCVFRVWMQTPFYAAGHYNEYPVSLPASKERLALAEKNLGMGKLDEEMVRYITCSDRDLLSCLPYSRNINEMNALAETLSKSGILKNDGTKKKLFAVLEAVVPKDMAEAAEIVKTLEDYELLPENVRTAENYAEYRMEKAGSGIGEEYRPFFDYTAYGEYCMRKDGVVQTENGMVFREGEPIPQLTEELTEFKLFSPLKAAMYLYDEEWGVISDQPEEISAEELCGYEEEILNRIEQEHLEEEGERGLAVYLGNLLLKRKVFSMNPAVESWNEELWGVLEVKTRGELSAQELHGLMKEWAGQESDGWGEGFEQRKIETKEGELYVSFWNSGKDFFIKTEQELKQEQTCGLGMRME